AYASNFGDYQVNWRTTLNTSASDITWATNVDAARTAYMNALCGEISTYASTVYGALEDYADALTSAGWAYGQSLFTASQTYETALSTADNAYSNTAYNAQKTAMLAYYDAAISELTQSIDLESKQKADEAKYCNLLATTQAEIIDDLFEDLEEITPDDGDGITNWLGTLGTTGTAATSVLSTENSARSGRNSTNTTALNDLKTTLAATRAKQEVAADRLYRNTEQGVWNTYLTGVQSANTAYLTSQKTAENTYKTAADVADTAYCSASVTAYTSFQEAGKTLSTAFYAAVADASDPTFTTTAYFTTTGVNGNLPYQKTTLANQSKKSGSEDDSDNFCPLHDCTIPFLPESWNASLNGWNARLRIPVSPCRCKKTGNIASAVRQTRILGNELIQGDGSESLYPEVDVAAENAHLASDVAATTAEVGISMLPGPGECMDVYTLTDSNSTILDRSLAAGSLGLSAFTLGMSPNFGKAGKICYAADAGGGFGGVNNAIEGVPNLVELGQSRRTIADVAISISKSIDQCANILEAKSLCSKLLRSGADVRITLPSGKLVEISHCIITDDLKRLVPDNVLNVPSKNGFIPSTTIEQGYKYRFILGDGTPVEIKWHSPDLGRATRDFPDGYSANMWTAQIKVGEEFFGADGLWYTNVGNVTHIPIIVP
ncbi:MAG: hypothetical protein PHE53_12485, partial [Thermoguttaceae bacterium]|nr:hypothetical protein [Thermoguttaceae bacterium]